MARFAGTIDERTQDFEGSSMAYVWLLFIFYLSENPSNV